MIADFASMWFMNCQNSLGYVYLSADADVLERMEKAVNTCVYGTPDRKDVARWPETA